MRRAIDQWLALNFPDRKQVSIREFCSHNREIMTSRYIPSSRTTFSCILSFIVSGILPLTTGAASSGAPAETKKSVIKTEVRRDLYLKRLKVELQRSLCTETSLLNCFKISKFDCHQTIGSNFGHCAKKANVPANVSLSGEDILIAESVGGCVSEKLGEKYQNKFLEGSECATRK
jgi:hypothetical protein